jgi:hypothetical protein
MRPALLLTALAAGCSLHTVHVTELSIAPTAPIFEKVTDPLYIVLDDVPVEVARSSRGSELLEVRAMARGPLKATLDPYFAEVIVIETSEHLPPSPHLELWLKVEEIGTRRVQGGPVDDAIVRSVPTLEWEAVLVDRVRGAVPFTYAASLMGEREMSLVHGSSAAWEVLFEGALADLAGQLVHTGTVRNLRDAPKIRVPAAPDLACPDASGGDAVTSL